jgi:hypothetical protein
MVVDADMTFETFYAEVDGIVFTLILQLDFGANTQSFLLGKLSIEHYV